MHLKIYDETFPHFIFLTFTNYMLRYILAQCICSIWFLTEFQINFQFPISKPMQYIFSFVSYFTFILLLLLAQRWILFGICKRNPFLLLYFRYIFVRLLFNQSWILKCSSIFIFNLISDENEGLTPKKFLASKRETEWNIKKNVKKWNDNIATYWKGEVICILRIE